MKITQVKLGTISVPLRVPFKTALRTVDAVNDVIVEPVLLEMGEALLGSGAEIYRAEDTLNRMGYAYGAAAMNVFVIPSSIVITMEMPDGRMLTQTRRIRSANSNDFTRLDEINELSRAYCSRPFPVEELRRRLREITSQRISRKELLAGCILGAGAFTVFFGGNLMDGLSHKQLKKHSSHHIHLAIPIALIMPSASTPARRSACVSRSAPEIVSPRRKSRIAFVIIIPGIRSMMSPIIT